MAGFTVEIDVYSDLVCPWCYLGKEALDKAIATYTAQHPEAQFKLNWKPYLLWPKVGESGKHGFLDCKLDHFTTPTPCCLTLGLP
jgi:predicted DsbA family dithiol-disulfide isomerase